MALKFIKTKGTAEYVAETPTAIYRVARGYNGLWSLRVDGTMRAATLPSKTHAVALADLLAADEAAHKARAAFRVVS